MRRIALWASSTITTLVLLFSYHTSTSGVAATTTTQEPIGTSTSTVASTTTSGTGPDDGTGTSTTSTTVTGDAAQTRYGPVQVQITTDGSSVTGVEVIQYPASDGRDVQINNAALPILVDETMTAQSANIDMVSGATYTSEGYTQSLQSALDQAGL